MFKGKSLIGLGLVIAIVGIGGFLAMSMRDQGPQQADVERVVNELLQRDFSNWQVRSLRVTSSETSEQFGRTVHVRGFSADVETHESRYSYAGTEGEFIFADVSVEQGRSATLTGMAEIVRHEDEWVGRAEFAEFRDLVTGSTKADLRRAYGGRNSTVVAIGTPEEAEARRTLAAQVEEIAGMIAGDWVGSSACSRASADRDYVITLAQAETAGDFAGTVSFTPGPRNERGAPGSFAVNAEYRQSSGLFSGSPLQINHDSWIDRPENAGELVFSLTPGDGGLTGRVSLRGRSGSACDIVLTRP